MTQSFKTCILTAEITQLLICEWLLVAGHVSWRMPCSILRQVKDPGQWTFLNEYGMYQTPSLLMTHLIRQSPTLEDATAWEPWAMFP